MTTSPSGTRPSEDIDPSKSGATVLLEKKNAVVYGSGRGCGQRGRAGLRRGGSPGLPGRTHARHAGGGGGEDFLTARAAARRMTAKGSGVIVTITASPSRSSVPLTGGMAPAWAAIEALSRGLAAELGPYGVRVVCLNAAGMPETPQLTEVYGLHAEAHGISRDAFRSRMTELTLRKRLPTVAEVADVAAFVASDRAGAITGAITNLTGGLVVG
ncbi:MAG TPA: SDR family oxidoreductase [Pseudonocardia sp.]